MNNSKAGDPESILNYLMPQLEASPCYRPDVENLMAVFLSAQLYPIAWQVISNGSLDTLLVHPREVFKPAIIMNAAAVVVLHNHPSGDPSPSESDIKVTRDLIRAGQLLNISLTDHVIIGRTAPDRQKYWTSLRELGYFYS